jgi:hypothetical protein
LRLWEEDLPRFEVISQKQKAAAAMHLAPPVDASPMIFSLFSQQDVDQLTLPFVEQQPVEDDQPELTFALSGANAVSERWRF